MDKVRDKLERDGEVSNFWAIEHRIFRLASIIWMLSPEYDFECFYEFEHWQDGKNFIYRIK